ncbi:hypothetical protein PPL_02860 [Heterostelium album PN500]|uniref:Beta-lactamase-related domain-containing protein n=1 Tax=Heterostelium pallidum (strain ATCC 26659 / Pp 5 / PN500) TaxID=670386 RepID=D3B394_HETP5|nr:hypothetical protein PPL_02860 [Heterostelium album PN500]EFA83792.1 hypothetical protein PPL_02860 [Heterostelium album PN500]|eukprot:XP_020435909.1 hypothetical protein PPL_02860 [Heterostelium album PN500]
MTNYEPTISLLKKSSSDLKVIGIVLVESCPEYPKPIPLDQSNPLLIEAYQQVDQMIQSRMNQYGIKSFIASIVYLDELVWYKAYGHINPLDNSSTPLTVDSNIRIASITKVFTDIMMFQLRDKGLLDLDDELVKYIPEFNMKNPYPTKRGITLRQLASHQAGLPREIPCQFNERATSSCTEKLILQRLSNQYLILPQYSTSHYSNLGVSLLGHAMERIKRVNTYEQYIKDNILVPLEMKSTTFNYNKIKDNLAGGTIKLPNGNYIESTPFTVGWGSPTGGLFSTARDMSKFMIFLLNTLDGNKNNYVNVNKYSKVLDPSTLNEAQEAIALIADGSSAMGTPLKMSYDQTNQLWSKNKNGAQSGYLTNMALIPPFQIGLFFGATPNINSEDIFTSDAAKILLPVYRKLLSTNNNCTLLKKEKDKTSRTQRFQMYNAELLLVHTTMNSFTSLPTPTTLLVATATAVYDLKNKRIPPQLIFKCIFLSLLFLWVVDHSIVLVESCPEYPTPIPLDQSNPLLIEAYQQVDQMIQSRMNQYGIKSFIASIVYLDELVWYKAYGHINPLDNSTNPLTIDSNIRLASITKVFTDIMMFQLRDKGLLNLDDELVKYIPEFSINNPYPTKRGITLRELASHQSGLPREIPCQSNEEGTSACTEQLILQRLSDQYLILPQYSITHYSNLGVSLLGHAMERIEGVNTYQQYITENILEPLEMKSTTFNYTEIQDNLARGIIQFSNGSYIESPVLPIGWGAPAGGLFSTGRDMSKFMIFLLNSLYSNSNNYVNGSKYFNILDPSTLNEAQEAIALIQDGSSAYGTPFEMYYNQDNQIWSKNKLGIQSGYTVNMALIPPFQIGLFFGATLNIDSEDVFTSDALDILLPVYQKLLLNNSLSHNNNHNKNKHKHNKEKDRASTSLKMSYMGLYKDNSTGIECRIGMYKNQLTLQFSGSLYSVNEFKSSLPLIQRILLIDTDTICKTIVDSYNNELIYFTTDTNNPTRCNTILIAGQTLQLITEDPNYITGQKIRLTQ